MTPLPHCQDDATVSEEMVLSGRSGVGGRIEEETENDLTELTLSMMNSYYDSAGCEGKII